MALEDWTRGYGNLANRLDDYLRWRLKLHYDIGPFSKLEFKTFCGYIQLRGRPAQVFADVGMRDGVVWEKRFSVVIETHSSEFDGWDYGLIVAWRLFRDSIHKANSIPA